MIHTEEYLDRLNQLQQKVQQKKLGAFVVTSQESIYYLTGVPYTPLERPFFIIIWPKKLPTLIVPALEEVHLRKAEGIGEIAVYREYPSPRGRGWPEILRKVLGKTKNIGVEPSMHVDIFHEIKGYSAKIHSLVEDMRIIKSPAEIEMIRTTAGYCDIAMKEILGGAYYDISELEIFSRGRTVQMRILKEQEYEALTTSILCMSWVAPDSAMPHSVPRVEDRLREGPHIAMSFLRVNGYAAECERTWFLTEPVPEVQKAFTVMMEARDIALSMAGPGTSCNAIDRRVTDFIASKGYGGNLLHRTGHGIGLGNHEGPWVAMGSRHILEENMVISIEPGIYLPGIGGVRHSDTALITSEGHTLLTGYPVEMDRLIMRKRKPLARLKGRIIRRIAGIE